MDIHQDMDMPPEFLVPSGDVQRPHPNILAIPYSQLLGDVYITWINAWRLSIFLVDTLPVIWSSSVVQNRSTTLPKGLERTRLNFRRHENQREYHAQFMDIPIDSH